MHKKSHTPVCDPLWSHYFLSSKRLYFVVGKVGGNDMCGFGVIVIEMELPTMQHHQPAQLIRTGNCTRKTHNTRLSKLSHRLSHSNPPDSFSYGAQLGNTGLSPACNVSQKPFHFIFPHNLAYSSI